MPKAEIPSVALEIESVGVSHDELARRLRAATPPIVGYVHEERFLLNLRTVFPSQDQHLAQALLELLQ